MLEHEGEDLTSPGAVPVPSVREHGWRRLLPAVAAFLFVQSLAPLRAFVPIEQTLVLLLPALAVCAWMSWRHGGRVWLALAWTGVALWVLSRPMAGGTAYVAFARGWSLVLAATFGTFGLVFATKPFFSRAMAALVAAAATFVVALALSGTTPRRVERVIAAELGDRVESSVASLRATQTTPDWQEMEKKNPDGARALGVMLDGLEVQLRGIPPIGALLFPAVLLLESLAALGIAWSLHHRLSRTRIGPPLRPLREFRFGDQYVWGFIAGLVFVLVPRFAAWKAVGWNLVAFFGALYVLRGLGVMMWFLVIPGRWIGVVVVTVVALFVPLWSFPLGLGLGDTYFDWRRRVRPSNQGSSQ